MNSNFNNIIKFWNNLLDSKAEFNFSQYQSYFHQDYQMRTNNKLILRNRSELAHHFKGVREALGHATLTLHKCFEISADRTVIRFSLVTERLGDMEVMALLRFENDQLIEFDEVLATDGKKLFFQVA